MNIEEHIRRAVEEGKFDNLPGKGKPLNLDENPFEDPGWRLAHKMLKDGGFSLPWIELRKEIEADYARARQELILACSAYRQAHQTENGRQAWVRAKTRFFDQMTDLNKKIFSFNIQAPNPRFHLRVIEPQKALDQITGSA
jgi:DnaJ family protein C protein 28